MGNQAILRAIGAEQVVLESVSAKGRVSGLFLELTVEQRYRNPSETNIEAVYTFPLPWGAVLMSLEFDINGKTLSGVVVPRAVGEARYEKAVDQGDTAVLLERAADGLYTANVGNLMAGESAVVRYRYAQLLRFEKGQVRLTVPTVIAPRYGAAEKAGLAPHQVPDTSMFAEYPFSISITLAGELANGSIACPSHSVAIRRVPEGVEAHLAKKGFLDHDFVLAISGVQGRGFGAVAQDDDGFMALASFCPAFPKASEPERRNVKILVDCSGSMAGSSIEAAKRALHAILSMLESRDRFSLSRFGSTVQHLDRELQPVNDATIGAAGRRVMGLNADMGGTEMAGAISSTLKLGEGTRADILLVTDGEVWAADEVMQAARASGQRIFAVGIGHAPAESLLRRLGEETGGACEFVAPSEDVEGAITRMFLRIAQEPASQVRVAWPNAVEWEVPPGQAIFDGETLHVFARFAARPSGEARLSFVLQGGKSVESAAVLGAPGSAGSDLPRLAAAKRIPLLATDEQRDIAVRYQLITELTNCVLVHERADKAAGLPELAPVRQMRARGWGGIGTEDITCMNLSMHDLSARYDAFMPSEDLRYRADASPLGFKKSAPAHLGERSAGQKSPRELLVDLSRGGGWIALLADRLPATIEDLQAAGVPEEILDELRSLVVEGFTQKDVVGAFLAALSALGAESGCSRQFARRLRNRLPKGLEGKTLEMHVSGILAGMTAEEWG